MFAGTKALTGDDVLERTPWTRFVTVEEVAALAVPLAPPTRQRVRTHHRRRPRERLLHDLMGRRSVRRFQPGAAAAIETILARP